MKQLTHILLFLLSMMFFSCAQETSSSEETMIPEKSRVMPEAIPVTVKWTDPDSFARSQSTPLKQTQQVVAAHSNMIPASEPIVIPLPKDLQVIRPGSNGTPLPKTVPARGRRVPAVQPKPIPALPPQMKDALSRDIRYLSVDQGLSSSQVKNIMKDSRGHLWITTAFSSSLSRYDGVHFYHYGVEEGLSGGDITSLLEDARGNIWMGSWLGLIRFDGNGVNHFEVEEGLKSGEVTAMCEDRNGDLWLGHTGGVTHYKPGEDGSDGTFTRYELRMGPQNETGQPIDQVFIMDEDRQGRIWIGTRSAGVYLFDPEGHQQGLEIPEGKKTGSFVRFTSKEGLASNTVRGICEDRQGHIWLSMDGGICRFDGENFTQFSTKDGFFKQFRTIRQDDQGTFWVGTDGDGLFRFDPDEIGTGGNFTTFTTQEGLSHNNVTDLLEDKQGVLWITTFGGGINRFDTRGFRHYASEPGLTNNDIRSILPDKQGNIWFGIYDDGFSHFDPGDAEKNRDGSLTHFSPEIGMANTSVITLLMDSRGNVWMGTHTDLIRLEPGNQHLDSRLTNFTAKEGAPNTTVIALLEDRQGDIWIGTWGKGLYRYDPDRESFTHYGTEEGLQSNTVLCLLEDRKGNIWMGGWGGIYRLESNESGDNERLSHFGAAFGGKSALLEDKEGRIWIGSMGNGFSLFDGNSFTNYLIKGGPDVNFISSIIEDPEGHIWMGTGKGIFRLNSLPDRPRQTSGSNTTEVIEIPMEELYTFQAAEGLRNANLPLKGLRLDVHNRLWMGYSGGLSRLDLNQFTFAKEAPQVELNHLEIAQNQVDYRRLSDSSYREELDFGQRLIGTFDSVAAFYNYPLQLSLPHDLDHLTFHFSAIDWAAPHKLQYSYFLDGLDEEWSNRSPENKADYRNLPPGKYTFRVKAIGAAQKWSEVFEYKFAVLPPWWLTGWAYLLYTLLAGLVIWSLIQWRTYSLRHQRQLLRDQVAEQTQEIRERNVELITAKQQAEAANEAKSTFLSTVSHELRTPLTSIIGFTKLNKKNLEEKVLPKVDPEDPKAQKAASRISKNLDVVSSEGERLTSLINELLDLAKIESGKVDWKMGELHPADLIERAVNATSALFAQKQGVELMTEVPENLPMIIGDKDRLLQVLINLISNAVKFTDEGQIKIGVSPTSNSQLSTLNFFVQDTGSGIPADQLDKVFERFQQVEDNQAGKPKGTGLGLPICNQIVEHHGGKIWVESEVGKGSTFFVSLPVKDAS